MAPGHSKAVAAEASLTASLYRLAEVKEKKEIAERLKSVLKALKENPEALKTVELGLKKDLLNVKSSSGSFSSGYLYLFKVPQKHLKAVTLPSLDPRFGEPGVQELLKSADKQYAPKCFLFAIVASGKDGFGPHVISQWDSYVQFRHEKEAGLNLQFLVWDEEGVIDWPLGGLFRLLPTRPDGAQGKHEYTKIALVIGGAGGKSIQTELPSYTRIDNSWKIEFNWDLLEATLTPPPEAKKFKAQSLKCLDLFSEDELREGGFIAMKYTKSWEAIGAKRSEASPAVEEVKGEQVKTAAASGSSSAAAVDPKGSRPAKGKRVKNPASRPVTTSKKFRVTDAELEQMAKMSKA